MDFVRQAFDAAKQGNLAFFNIFLQNPRMADMRDENDDSLMHVAGKSYITMQIRLISSRRKFSFVLFLHFIQLRANI